MKIDMIMFPYVFTDTGERVLIADCVAQPRVGDRLEFDENLQLYQVFKSSGEGCANGACGLDKIGD